MNEQISAKINIIASIPPRTIFKNDKEIEINIARNNDEFVDFIQLLRELDNNKTLLQRVYSMLYRYAESKIVESRKELQQQYGHLLK